MCKFVVMCTVHTSILFILEGHVINTVMSTCATIAKAQVMNDHNIIEASNDDSH